MKKHFKLIGIKSKVVFYLWFLMFIPTAINASNSNESVILAVTSDWGSGFIGEIDLTNNTSSVYNSWEVGFDFPHNITSIWNAKIKSHSGNHYVFENESWNGALQPNSTVSIGFQGTPGGMEDKAITNITVNGISVDPPHENSPPVANNDTASTNQDTSAFINVLNNDTDADNDTLTISSVTTPSNGTSKIQGSSINYIPNAGFYGNDFFEYTINDGNGGTDTATITITVNDNPTETYTISVSIIGNSGDNYPIFVQPMAGDQLYAIGDKVTFNERAYESLIDNNSWSPSNYPRGWKSIPQGGGGESTNGTITPNGEVTVNEGETQTFTITPDSGNRIKDIKVDGSSVGKISFYTFTNVATNHTITAEFEDGEPTVNGPVANNDTGSAEQNNELNLSVLSNDTGEGISITSISVPKHGVAETSGKTIVYTPETDYTGNDSFNYTIIDSKGRTDNALVSINITTPLDPSDPIAIVGNNPFRLGIGKVDVSISETGRLTPTDPGSPIKDRFNVNNLNSLKKSALSMAQGSVTFLYLTRLKEKLESENATPNVVNKILQTFGPNFFLATTYQETGIGIAQSGNGYFQIDNPLTGILQDAGAVPVPEKDYLDYFNFLGNRNYNQVIQQFNQNSFCTSAIVKSYYNSNALLIIMKNLASNKYTTREFPLIPFAINYANNPNHSNSVILPNTNNYNFSSDSADGLMRIIGYAYNRGYSHPSIPFILMNNTNGSRRINYYINYGQYLNGTDKGNDVPNGGIYEGTKYMFQIPAVYTSLQNMTQNQYEENISKEDIDSYLDSLTALYSRDTINAGKAMAAKVMDSSYAFNSLEFHKKFAQITIAMLEASAGHSEDPVNNPPTANNDTAETSLNSAVSVNVLANDTDADGDTLTISAVNTPQNGTAAIVSSSIVYTPDTGFTGTDTFEYTVSDSNGGTDTATVTITVSRDPIPITYTITASVNGSSGNGNYPDFIQPMAGDSLYMIGDRVTFNSKAYESLINSNSWSPTAYPGGWKSISQGGGNTGGTITPNGDVTVNEGLSQTFTMIPDPNSCVKDVKIDNVSQGVLTAYTFDDISSNHTISVEFREKNTPSPNVPPTVTFKAPANNATITLETLSPINISVSAQDSDGTVESITINVDGTDFSGTTASWTPSEYGTHRIIVTVTDNEGADSIGLITVIVEAGTPQPTTKKQVIGYFTQWEPWFGQKHGYPEEGVANHLNIDYSKYTMLNYSFFGVAKDGSLHSGDFRDKLIYKTGALQEPRSLLYGDIYSSWDYWLLYGELDLIWDVNDSSIIGLGYEAVSGRIAEEFGYKVKDNPSYNSRTDIWYNSNTQGYGLMPIPAAKKGGAPGLIKLCKENNVKLMASIGGWSMCKHFPEMAADPIKKAKFLEGCRYLINMGFDGIDIDWEYPNDIGMNIENASFDDYANFTSLMRDIRAEIGPDKILTAAFSCDPNKLENLDWAQLDMYMDYYNMMTYDMNGGWSDITGHNSPLYGPDNGFSWDRTFRYLTEVKSISPEKINMGVAFYGRGVVTNGPASLGAPTLKTDIIVDPDGPVHRASDLITWEKYIEQPNYFYIKQKITGWTHEWDDIAKVPYSVNGSSFVSYDNERSVELKANYVMQNELGGVIIWHVTGDWEVGTVTNTYGEGGKLKKAPINTPLLDVIHNVFNEGTNPTANYKFPQHVNYPLPHILPSNYSQSAMDSDVKNYYDYWKQNYLVDAGSNINGKHMYRVNYDGNTVSEGQGYGMIITAIMAGYDPDAKNIFDGLWYFAKSMPSEINSNFMDWSLNDTSGNDSAFDGDADIAYALLIADKQWGNSSEINYKSNAVDIIDALRSDAISNSTYLPFLGDWVTQNDAQWNNVSRTSDFMLANFRAFDNSIANSDWTENIIYASQSKLLYIQNNFSPNTGLIPDFIKNGDPATGTVLESNYDGKYFYNACRVPLRVGMDALLSNNDVSKNIVQEISTWAESSTLGNINNFYAGYELNGTPFNNYSATSFTAPLGVAAMCTGEQTWLNNIYVSVRVNYSGEYYEDTLTLISMLIMTGNFWDSTIVQ